MKQAESFKIEMARLVKLASDLLETNVADGVVKMTFDDGSELAFTKPVVDGKTLQMSRTSNAHEVWLKSKICDNCKNKIWELGDGTFGDPL